MALQPGSLFDSDATGATETITLEPLPPATSTAATIASAFYGTDDQGIPQPVQIAVDGKSMSFTVLTGVNPLVITLVSPNPNDEIVQLSEGGTVLANPVLSRHKAVFTIFIKGT
jgi:hypothetical protein